MNSDNSKSKAPEPTGAPVTVSIYQNPDYIEGILQQVFDKPLYTDLVESSESSSNEGLESVASGEGKLDLTIGVAPMGKAQAGIGGGGNRSRSELRSSAGSSSSSAKYTQAYYLHLAVRELVRRDALRAVSGTQSARELKAGDIVRFEAEFRPSQLISIIDIATPELVGGLVRHFVKRSSLKGDKHFKGNNENQVKSAIARADSDAESWTGVAKAAAEAVRIDFRSPDTREYYGAVGSGDDEVIAVTICDVANFVVDDEDRILDGRFTVLGKVAASCVEDEPILARNKLLNRLNPEAVDELVDTVNVQVRKQESDAQTHVDAPFNFRLDSRISGVSFKVIPIAIYL